MSQKLIQLRPHHLLCILTHVGKGYSDAFVENMGRVIEGINNGATIKVVRGLDDICAACSVETVEDYHCQDEEIVIRDQNAMRDLANLMNQALSYGMQLTLTNKDLYKIREAFAAGKIRNACKGCEWHELCTTIADEDFKNTKLR